MGRDAGVGALLSEARQRAVDDAGVSRAEGLVVDAEALDDAGPVAFDNGVGAVSELEEDLDAAGGAKIEIEAALVAEVDAVAGDRVRPAPLLCEAGLDDGDDVGAVVGEHT